MSKTKFYDDYCMVNGNIKVIISDLYDFYVIQNHRYTDTCQHFNIKKGALTHIMNHYGLVKPRNLSHKWNKVTCKELYGDENYNNTQQNRLTCLERYGVDNQFKRTQFIIDSHIKAFGATEPNQVQQYNEKIRESWHNKSKEELYNIRLKREASCLKSLGVKSPMQNTEVAKKNASVPGKYDRVWETKKKNKTTNTSKPEDVFNEFLINLFGEDDIKRNYKSDKYPFHCDFYIKSIDTYIELNLFWTHMGHPFSNSLEDLRLLESLEQKSNNNQYTSAIKVWTVTDPLKMSIAKENKLNYYYAYDKNQINLIMEKLYEFKFSKECV